MFVPSGKKIRLYVDDMPYLSTKNLKANQLTSKYPDYVEIPMYLGQDLSLKVSSEYHAPFQSMQDKVASMGVKLQTAMAGIHAVGNMTNNVKIGELLTKIGKENENTSLQSQQASFQVWKYSKPISFSFTVQFYMGIDGYYDAKLEVFYPTLRLMELVLPTAVKDGGVLTRLNAPGPTMSTLLSQLGEDVGVDTKVHGTSFSLNIGNIVTLDSIIVNNVESTFSKELDKAGYPISSNVSIQVQTTTVATANMIQDMAKTNPSELKQQLEEDREANSEAVRKEKIASWAQKLLG